MLFTFPSRYWFAIGHRRVLSLGGWSPLLRTGFHVPGPTRDPHRRAAGVRVRGSHPLRPALPCRSAPRLLCNRPGAGRAPGVGPATPGRQRLPLTLARVWAGALSLAATRAVSVDFLSSGYLDVSVPRVVRLSAARAWPRAGSPIRRPADHRLCAPPRGLSQLAASFVDFLCQGIRLAP